MLITDFRPNEGENEYAFLWRVCSARENGELEAEWEDIANLMNKCFRTDESEYRTSSAYRKPYQYAKMFIENDVFSDQAAPIMSNDAEELIRLRAELQKERVRLHDERVQYNRYVRDTARLEQKLDEMEIQIKTQADTRYIFPVDVVPVAVDQKREMLVLLSDWHIGLEFDNEFGRFNREIAEERLHELTNEIYIKKINHGCEVCNIALLGDIINGRNCWGVALENRENVIEQMVIASQMVSDLMATLCNLFAEVNFVCVSGNHSRLEKEKKDSLKDERLDNLIGWYVKSALKGFSNFKPRVEVDSTVAELGICGQLYYFAHGEFDVTTQAGISKLAFMLGAIPYAVCIGHNHTPALLDVNGVKVVQNGCLPGSGNDYTVQNRMSGLASQTILICNEDGIECMYPVVLEH